MGSIEAFLYFNFSLVDLGDENITTLSTQSENDTTELPTKRITDQAYSAVLMVRKSKRQVASILL